MKILITGSNGFIGRNLIDKLAGYSAIIRCLNRHDKPRRDSDNFGIMNYTINYSRIETLLDCEAFDGVEYIFHLAGITKGITMKQFYAANVLPTKNLLETVKKRNIKLKRFVFLSSQAAGGPSESLNIPKNPDDPPLPVEYYGMSKLDAERLLKKYSDTIPITILRPSAVYGPGDRDFLDLFKQVNSGIQLYWGTKDNYFNLIFIDDLLNGILKATFSENTIGKSYFLCNDMPITWGGLSDILSDIIEKKPVLTLNLPPFIANIGGYIGLMYSLLTRRQLLVNPQKIKLSKQKYWVCSTRHAKEDFNFNPDFSLVDGLKITLGWYKRNKWIR